MNNIFKVFLTSLVILFIPSAYSLPQDSTSLVPSTPGPMIYTTAYLNLSLTSQNDVSSCALPAGPNNYCPINPSSSPSNTSPPSACSQPAKYVNAGLGTWSETYVTCPKNSLQVTSFSISSNTLQSCVCNRQSNCATSNASVTMAGTGNLGLIIQTITCFVPVNIWLPVNVVQNGGAATLNGSPVYVSFWGTMPLIQPDQATPSFTATYDTNGTWSGPYASLMSQIIPPASFDYQTIYFAGCGCLENSGCGNPPTVGC